MITRFSVPKDAGRVFVGEEEGEALGRGQEDVRRVSALAFPGGGLGVAGPVLDPDREGEILDGRGEVPADIGSKRLQGRDVERVEPVRLLLR